MTIYLGNPMVRSNAPAGTGSGTLSADEGHTQIPSGGIGGQYSAKGTGVDDLGFGDRAVRLAHDGFRVTRGHCRPKAAYVANETRILSDVFSGIVLNFSRPYRPG